MRAMRARAAFRWREWSSGLQRKGNLCPAESSIDSVKIKENVLSEPVSREASGKSGDNCRPV